MTIAEAGVGGPWKRAMPGMVLCGRRKGRTIDVAFRALAALCGRSGFNDRFRPIADIPICRQSACMLQANRGKIAIAFAIGLAFAAYSQLRVFKERPTYALEMTLLTHYADEVDDVPKYQSDSAEWFAAGGRINDLSKFLAQDTGNHIGRPYLVFALEKNATSETVRSALADLTKRQICYAGILDFPPDDIPTDHMAVIFRIVSVNEKDGTVHRCEERSNVPPG